MQSGSRVSLLGCVCRLFEAGVFRVGFIVGLGFGGWAKGVLGPALRG